MSQLGELTKGLRTPVRKHTDQLSIMTLTDMPRRSASPQEDERPRLLQNGCCESTRSWVPVPQATRPRDGAFERPVFRHFVPRGVDLNNRFGERL